MIENIILMLEIRNAAQRVGWQIFKEVYRQITTELFTC